MIRVGQQFKFLIDDGKYFMVSERYQTMSDADGNINNVFDPQTINRDVCDDSFEFNVQEVSQIYHQDFRAMLIDSSPGVNCREKAHLSPDKNLRNTDLSFDIDDQSENAQMRK